MRLNTVLTASLLVAGLAAQPAQAQPAKPAAPADTIEEANQHCADNSAALQAGTADAQNAWIQYCLGAMSAFRDHDGPAALTHLKAADTAGYAPADMMLAIMYQTGQGVAKSDSDYIQWLKAAADKGQPEAQTQYGKTLFFGWNGMTADPAAGLAWVRKAADAGLADAQTFTGMAYRDGRGVAKDVQAALKWLRAAAAQGDANAQNGAGYMLFYGDGVPADPAAAIPLLRASADQGQMDSQTLMAEAYMQGKGVTKDVNEALRRYRLAADQGQPYAIYMVGGMMYDGTGQRADREGGTRFISGAAAMGIADAQVALAGIDASGKGAPRDDVAALTWYETAALITGQRDAGADAVEKRLKPDQVAQAKSDAKVRVAQGRAGPHAALWQSSQGVNPGG